MGFLKYTVRNITRNKLRSTLTVMSLAVCMCLMTVVYGFIGMQDAIMPELIAANRVIVMNNQGFFGRIPMAHLDYVQGVPGVRAVVPFSWYTGVYKGETMPSSQVATDSKQIFDVLSEVKIDPEQQKAFQGDRQGAVIDRRSAARRGWKVGERIPLRGTLVEIDLELTLRGIYDGPEFIQDLYFHMEYLDETLRQQKNLMAGTTSLLFLKAESDDAIPGICRAIDARFGNSDSPTLSQSHQAFAQMFSKFVGNLNAYVQNIGIIVVLALILVSGNAMGMATRERTTEIAVLKAIGFRKSQIQGLVLSESVALSLLGGILGVLIGRGLWALGHKFAPQILPLEWIAFEVFYYALSASFGIGLVSGAVPAWRAAQLSVIDGLRRVV